MTMVLLAQKFKLSSFSCLFVLSFLLQQAVGCQDSPVGIADSNIIPDNRFTASSYYDSRYQPKYARLNGANRGWGTSTSSNPNDYLQIDLGEVFDICAVATQGGSAGSEWVTQYKISTSIDNNIWTIYPSGSSAKLFSGNRDSNTVVKNVLNSPAQARYIRFIPTSYNGWKVLRVEAYKYIKGNSSIDLGTNVICQDNYMQIDLKNSLLPDVDWRSLHLKDKSCNATKTNDIISLRTPFDGCGTTYTENNNTVVFLNEVRNDYDWQYVSYGSNVSRGRNFVIPFYCEYERSRLVSTSFSPSKKTVVASEGAYGNFTFTMDLYHTSQYRTPYSPFAYPVVVYPNQPLWVQYQVKNTNADLVVFAENCRATTSTNPNSSPQHVILQRGCVRDSTMVYSYDPHSRVQRFSIRSFRFVYSNTFLVYLHCQLIVCHRNTTNSRCARGCISSRRRRDTADLDGSRLYDLSAGPLKGSKMNANGGNQYGKGSSKSLIGGLAAVGGIFFLITILLSVIVYRRRGQVNKPTNVAMDVTVNSYEQDGVESDEKNDSQI